MQEMDFNVSIISSNNYDEFDQDVQGRSLIKKSSYKNNKIGLFLLSGSSILEDSSYNSEAKDIVLSYFSGWWEDILIPTINTHDFADNIINVLLDNAITVVNSIVNGIYDDIGIRIYPEFTLLLIFSNTYIIRKLGAGNVFLVNKKIKSLTQENSWLDEFVRAKILTPQEVFKYKKRKARNNIIEHKLIINDDMLIKKQGNIKKGDAFLLCCEDVCLHDDKLLYLCGLDNYNEVQSHKLADCICLKPISTTLSFK